MGRRFDLADTDRKAKLLYNKLGALGHKQKRINNRIKSYQRWHGMDVVDGWAGPATARVLSEPRCHLADTMRSRRADNALCAWSRGAADDLGIRIADRFGRHDPEAIAELFQEAIDAWSLVGNLRGKVRNSNPHVNVTYGRIGGPGGTLAWSQLPCGPDRLLTQKYDSGDTWGISPFEGPHPRGAVPLILTAIHELGHALGLDHSRNRRDIMYPSLQIVDRLGPGDIKEIEKRYGKPTSPPVPPTPPEPPAPPGGEVERIIITGRNLKVSDIEVVEEPSLL